MRSGLIVSLFTLGYSLLLALPVHVYLTGKLSTTTVIDCKAFSFVSYDGFGMTSYQIRTDFASSPIHVKNCNTSRCPLNKARGAAIERKSGLTCGDQLSVLRSTVSGAHVIFRGQPSLTNVLFSLNSPVVNGLICLAFLLSVFGVLISLNDLTAYVKTTAKEEFGRVLARQGNQARAVAESASSLLMLGLFASVVLMMGYLAVEWMLYSPLAANRPGFAIVAGGGFVALLFAIPIAVRAIFLTYMSPVGQIAKNLAGSAVAGYGLWNLLSAWGCRGAPSQSIAELMVWTVQAVLGFGQATTGCA